VGAAVIAAADNHQRWKDRVAKRALTPEEQEHQDRVRALGCIVTRNTHQTTIHHCHSGSMAEEGLLNRGSTRSNHFLVIPLHINLHSMGPWAIDGNCGVQTWELQFGRQVDHLDRVSRMLGYNVWKMAGIDREVPGVDA
jgi:hypothetical protein